MKMTDLIFGVIGGCLIAILWKHGASILVWIDRNYRFLMLGAMCAELLMLAYICWRA